MTRCSIPISSYCAHLSKAASNMCEVRTWSSTTPARDIVVRVKSRHSFVRELTGWGGHLFRRFCNMCSISSPHLLGQLQYSPTACGTLRKKFTKPSEQVAAPPSTACEWKRMSGPAVIPRSLQWVEQLIITCSRIFSNIFAFYFLSRSFSLTL